MRGEFRGDENPAVREDLGYAVSVLDRFLAPDQNDGHWLIAVKLAAEIGYPVLNMAAVSKYNGALLWARSTMSDRWADIYMREDYVNHDPLIAHMQKSNAQFVLDCDQAPPKDAGPGLVEFMEAARKLGYGRFRGIPFNWPTQTVYKIITFGMMAGKSSEESDVMIRKARILAEIFATRISAPSAAISFGAMWPPKALLSERERELLYFLAIGLKNDRIADRCGLAEVTVRKHLLSARRKLGASTREQALAIALQNGLINF